MTRQVLLDRLDALTGRQVLVIDDDPASRYVLQKLLSDGSTRVIEAGDCESGLEAARRSRPVAIFLDLHLPDGSGEDVLGALRDDASFDATPVAIVTSRNLTLPERAATRGRRRSSCSKRASSRPPSRALSSSAMVSDVSEPGEFRAAPVTVILNVDDTAASRYSKTRMLRQAGYSVIEAATGTDALELARKHTPSLVLLDVNLPDMSGIEVARRIKSDPVTRSVPIVQISATHVTEYDQQVGLEGGAEIYLTEPLQPHELTTVVRVLLRLHSTERGLLQSEARWRSFIESDIVGVMVLENDRIIEANGALQSMLGYDGGGARSARLARPDTRRRPRAQRAGICRAQAQRHVRAVREAVPAQGRLADLGHGRGGDARRQRRPLDVFRARYQRSQVRCRGARSRIPARAQRAHPRRGRDAAQGRVPREPLARAAHPDERDHGLDAPAQGRTAR